MFVSSILHTYIYGKNKLVVLCLFKTLGKYCDKFLNLLMLRMHAPKPPFLSPVKTPQTIHRLKNIRSYMRYYSFFKNSRETETPVGTIWN